MDQTLTFEEVRVLGVLIEKELSTPEYYPMTAHALAAACNQKTNRDPVVSFTESQVEETLAGLQRHRLVGTASGAYSRATKYRHTLKESLSLEPPAMSILAELMLRGPQTTGELRGRTARMHTFDGLDAVEAMLEELAGREQPLVVRLERQPGQKEVRYAHLLSGEPDVSSGFSEASGDGRLDALEQEVAGLKERLAELEAAFAAFRRQFE